MRLVALAALKPGDRLPNERQLTNRSAVSRSTVREALLALELCGVIEVLPGSGCYLIGGGGGPPLSGEAGRRLVAARAAGRAPDDRADHRSAVRTQCRRRRRPPDLSPNRRSERRERVSDGRELPALCSAQPWLSPRARGGVRQRHPDRHYGVPGGSPRPPIVALGRWDNRSGHGRSGQAGRRAPCHTAGYRRARRRCRRGDHDEPPRRGIDPPFRARGASRQRGSDFAPPISGYRKRIDFIPGPRVSAAS